MIPRPPRSTRTDTLFPYTTLFRSSHETLETIPAGALIKQGNVDFRVPSIAERLRGEGYLTSYQDITADRYTLEMAEAVRRLQADHGIKADGVVGADTLHVLNTGAAGRARQQIGRAHV